MSQYFYKKHNTTWKVLCTVLFYALVFVYQRSCSFAGRTLVWLLVRQQLVRKYHTHILSMELLFIILYSCILSYTSLVNIMADVVALFVCFIRKWQKNGQVTWTGCVGCLWWKKVLKSASTCHICALLVLMQSMVWLHYIHSYWRQLCMYRWIVTVPFQ